MPEDKSELAVLETTQYSVREFQPGVWAGILGDGLGYLVPSAIDLIAPWGTPQCDWMLRVMHYAQHNALWSGAHNIWIEKVLSTPYEISGGRNLTFQWQDIFFASDFGEGYDFTMQKALSDYLVLNRGMFLELVSYGDPSEPLKPGAEIIGVNHLDGLRMVYTGNLEHPYIYYSEYTGKAHQLHRTRVVNLTHSPSSNTRMYGMGKSYLYDALTVANAQILLGRHQNELLADQPPPGLVIFNNVNSDQVESIMAQFEADRRRDGQNVYRGALRINSMDPTKPATVQFVPLASVPEGFNYGEYMQQHVNLLALVMGLDPQDIWPLSGQALGTGTQSRVLSQKTQTKGPGAFLTRLERMWNTVLPRQLEFKFKAQNSEQDLETANIAKLWTDIANAATFADEMEKRQLVANQVPAFADVLLDEQGNVRLPDDDPKAQGQEVIATDNIELDAADSNQNDVTAQDTVQADTPQTQPNEAPPQTKAIDDTESAYISDLTAVIQDGVDRVSSKAQTASRFRGTIVKYGKSAYIDGLEDGGVTGGELDDDDLRLIADYNVWDSVYVTDIVNEIYSTAGLSGTPAERAAKWVSTLNRFYYGGIASADKNGMYIFTGDDGKENCATCASLKGVKHRMKWWVENELRPGIDHHMFDCGTWPGNCNHYLEKVTK